MAICPRPGPAPVAKCLHLLTSAKTEKKRSGDDTIQLCGLVLIVEGLRNQMCPASSRAGINSSKKARRNRHATQPPQGPSLSTNVHIRDKP